MRKKKLKDELTAEMHYELIGCEMSDFDFRIMAACAAIWRGVPKAESLRKNNLTEREYDDNIERVLSSTP